MEKIKYPIKYGTMPIIDQVGWTSGLNQLERDYDVVAYIVSKCYVASEKKQYKADGNYDFRYEVIFPYIYNYYMNEYNKIIDIRDVNKIIIKELFDDYNDAVEYCDKGNAKLCCNFVSYLPVEKMKEAKQNFLVALSNYKKLEEKLEKENTDMIITGDIIIIGDLFKITNDSKLSKQKVIER